MGYGQRGIVIEQSMVWHPSETHRIFLEGQNEIVMHRMIVAIQARLSSERLPGKILHAFCGMPMLAYQMLRLQQGLPKSLDVVALVPSRDYTVIAMALDDHGKFAIHGVPHPEEDVLGRYAWYAKAADLIDQDVLIRITGDCPLICPFLIQEVLAEFLQRESPAGSYGFEYYGMGPGWPDGLGDIDIFRVGALRAAHRKATHSLDREHVTPYIWSRPETYKQGTYTLPHNLIGRRWPKFSVDTQEDFDYVHAVAQSLAQLGRPYAWTDVLYLIGQMPALKRHYEAMNAGYLAQLGTTEKTWEEIRYGHGSKV